MRCHANPTPGHAGNEDAAGLLEATMPAAGPSGGVFVDSRGRIVCHDGVWIRPDFLTGLAEQRLAVHAAWALTPLGQRIASEVRVHKGNRGDWHSLVPAAAVQE